MKAYMREKHAKGPWWESYGNFLRSKVTKRKKKKALVNYRDNEGVAMCKANDSNECIHKSTLILGQEKKQRTQLIILMKFFTVFFLKYPEFQWIDQFMLEDEALCFYVIKFMLDSLLAFILLLIPCIFFPFTLFSSSFSRLTKFEMLPCPTTWWPC